MLLSNGTFLQLLYNFPRTYTTDDPLLRSFLRQATCHPASYVLLRNQESGNIFSLQPSALTLNSIWRYWKIQKSEKINIFRKFKGDFTTYLPLDKSWHPEASLTAAPEGNHGLWRQTWAVSSATAINLEELSFRSVLDNRTGGHTNRHRCNYRPFVSLFTCTVHLQTHELFLEFILN